MSNKSFHRGAKCIHRPRRKRRGNPLYPCIDDTCALHDGHRDDRRDTFVCVYSAAACNPRNKIQKNGRRMQKRRDGDVERMRRERFRARASCARAINMRPAVPADSRKTRFFFSPATRNRWWAWCDVHVTPIKLHTTRSASFLVMRVFSNEHN